MEDSEGHQRIHVAAGSGKSKLTLGSGSIDRADMVSACSSLAGVLMSGQYAGYSSSIYAGKRITLQASGYLGLVIPTLLEQQYPQTLAKNGLSGSSLKLPLGMQTDTMVALTASLLHYGWKKLWLDFDVKSRFEDLAGYLLRWDGTTRMELHGPSDGNRGDDILIGSDKGRVDLQAGNSVGIRTQGEFHVRSMSTTQLLCPTGALMIDQNRTMLLHFQPLGTMFKRSEKDGYWKAFVDKLKCLKFWDPPKDPPADLMVDQMFELDMTKPRHMISASEEGVKLIRREEVAAKTTSQLVLSNSGSFCTKDDLLLSAGGGPDKPEDGPFIRLKKNIFLDCSKNDDAKVEITGGEKRVIRVNSDVITLDTGDGKASIILQKNGNIQINSSQTLTIKATSIGLNASSKKIDCFGAKLTNCPNIGP
jgi:hypothetical protein